MNNASAFFEGNPKKTLVSVKKEGEEGAEGGEPKAEEGGAEGETAAKR